MNKTAAAKAVGTLLGYFAPIALYAGGLYWAIASDAPNWVIHIAGGWPLGLLGAFVLLGLLYGLYLDYDRAARR